MLRRKPLLVASLVSLSFSIASAQAQLYRSRDTRGHLVITNVRPGGSARALSGGTLSVASAPGRTSPAPALRLVAARADDRRAAPFREHVKAASVRYTVPVRLIEAVIAVESGFNPQALSSKGAQGLMQLMPDTARDLEVLDPWDPAANIHGGVRYLRQMLDLFNQDLTLALAAYNAGPNAVKAANGVPLITETIDYVRKVKTLFKGGLLSYGSSSLSSIKGGNGRILLTNVGSTPSSIRMLREPKGVALLTNR